jgi:hypothetical protein
MTTENSMDRIFLGRGWTFPPKVNGGSIAMSSAEDDIRQAIRIILETAPGERVMRPDFGAGLRRMVFNPITRGSLSLAQSRIEQSLLLWEPRIDVKSVSVGLDQDRLGVLLIEIRYRIRESNSLSNFVYPFYLTEGR